MTTLTLVEERLRDFLIDRARNACTAVVAADALGFLHGFAHRSGPARVKVDDQARMTR